ALQLQLLCVRRWFNPRHRRHIRVVLFVVCHCCFLRLTAFPRPLSLARGSTYPSKRCAFKRLAVGCARSRAVNRGLGAAFWSKPSFVDGCRQGRWAPSLG